MNPYFALSDSLSLTTLHLMYDGYLANAALSVLSLTSFERSPTNSRNQAALQESASSRDTENRYAPGSHSSNV